MMGSEEKFLAITNEVIFSKIVVLRQQKVLLRVSLATMLDKTYVLLYHLETKYCNHNRNIEVVFRYLDELIEKNEEPSTPRPQIGYKA